MTSTVLKTDTADSNGRVYSKEALEKAVKEYIEKKKEEGEMIHEAFFGPYKGTEDGRLVEVDFGEIYNDMFGKEQTIDEEIKLWSPEYYAIEGKYYSEHCTCPVCGGRDVTTTMRGPIFDCKHPDSFKDINDVECINCGWQGIRHDMVPEKRRGLSAGFSYKWKTIKDDKAYNDLNDMASKIHENRVSIDEEIKEQAHWLANNFSTRNGYTSMEENLIKMGEFVKNRMLDKYNLENDNKN